MATARPSRWRRSRATTRRRACRRGRPRSSRATSTGAIRSPSQHVLSATGHRPRSAGRRPHACSGSGSGSEFGSEFGQQLDLGLGRRLGLSLGPGLGLDLGRSGSVSSRLHATPKSAILISPQSESSRLAHLMSRWTWGLGAGESVTLAAPHGRTAASLPHEAPARVECAAQPAAWRLGPRRPGQRAVAPPRRALSTDCRALGLLGPRGTLAARSLLGLALGLERLALDFLVVQPLLEEEVRVGVKVEARLLQAVFVVLVLTRVALHKPARPKSGKLAALNTRRSASLRASSLSGMYPRAPLGPRGPP